MAKTLYSYPPIASISIDYGDGSPVQYASTATAVFSHQYEPGTWAPAITIEDTNGLVATRKKIIKVGNTNGGAYVSTDWEIDGENYSVANPSVNFTESGTKRATVTVENDLGQIASRTKVVKIGLLEQPVIALWDWDDGSTYKNDQLPPASHVFEGGSWDPSVTFTMPDGSEIARTLDPHNHVVISAQALAIQNMEVTDGMILLGAKNTFKGLRMDNLGQGLVNL